MEVAQPNNNKEDVAYKSLYILKEPLPFRKAVPFLRVRTIPVLTAPEEYIIFLKDVPSEREVIEVMSEIAVFELVSEILGEEKRAKRTDKKKPYRARKTRDPVSRRVESRYAQLTDKDIYENALSAVIRMTPVLNSLFGRPLKLTRSRYDPLVIVALLLVKLILCIGYRKLEKLAKSLKIADIRKSWLNKIVTKKLNLAWFWGLTVLLDMEIEAVFGEFFGFDKLKFTMIDGTKLKRAYYDYSGETAKKKTLDITVSFRVLTSSVRTFELGLPADVSTHFKAFRKGDIILMDGFYDAEANFEEAWFREIEIHCPIGNARRGAARKWAKSLFNKKIYRYRKVGEKSFTLVFTRLEPITWHESNDLIYVTLAAAANNIKALIRAKIRINLFYKVKLRR